MSTICYECVIEETPTGFMDDEIKRLASLEDHIEQQNSATLHIQDCIKILIRIFETKGSYRMLAKLKEDYKKLELITSEFENKT